MPRIFRFTLYFACLFVCLLLLPACTESKQSGAEGWYQQAETAYNRARYHVAKAYIDSLNKRCPRELEVRKKARLLMFRINQAEARRTLAYCDSLLQVREPALDSLQKQFILSSDSQYVNYRMYVHKAQQSRGVCTGLQVEVRDNGELQMVSVYAGSELNHIAFRVSADDVFAQTDTIGLESAYNNRFDDLGLRWEYVTFPENNLHEVPGFLMNYADRKLKVTLQGRQSAYAYYLTPRENEILCESVKFAKTLKEVQQLGEHRTQAEASLVWLSEKLKDYE